MSGLAQSTPPGHRPLPREWEKCLNSADAELVESSLRQLAQEDSHLDLRDIQLSESGHQAVCKLLENPLSDVRFDRVTWGLVPDAAMDRVLLCLFRATETVFDCTKLARPTYIADLHMDTTLEFRDFETVLSMCMSHGVFKVPLVVNSHGATDSLIKIEQMRKMGAPITDTWRHETLCLLNSGVRRSENAYSLRYCSVFDLRVETDQGESVLTEKGMQSLIELMCHNQLGVFKSAPMDSLALGRVQSLEHMLEMDASRAPKHMDLRHARICRDGSDKEELLSDVHAGKLATWVSIGTSLSLERLEIDASEMSEKAVADLRKACDAAKVRLTISGRHSDFSSPVSEVDEKLSGRFIKACRPESVYWILQQVKSSPESFGKLSAQAIEQLKTFAEQLVENDTGFNKEHGETILEHLPKEYPRSYRVDEKLSAEFAHACQYEMAWWIDEELKRSPGIAACLDPKVKAQVKAYAEGLRGGGGLAAEYAQSILMELDKQ